MNQHVNFERVQMIETAKTIIKDLVKAGYSATQIDCWSIKGGGLTTEDCDIAIDIKYYDAKKKITTFQPIKIEVEPYGPVFPNLTRLKFKLNTTQQSHLFN